MTKKLDWSTEYSDEEWAGLTATYDKLLGEGELDAMFKFIPFMHDIRPDTLKRYRLDVDVVTQGVGLEDGMQNPPVCSMVAGHFYTTLPYTHGVAADLFVAKRYGGRKQEVADILGLAWLHAGMNGMNATSRISDPLMKEWDPADDGPGLEWPEGWTVEPEAFRCGIDFSEVGERNEITPEELDLLRGWHLRVQGEVPLYVDFFARHYPLALKAFRARYETSTDGTLPKQFIALCFAQLAAHWKDSSALRRSLHMARHFGVKKEHAVQILAYSQIYLGDLGMDAALRDLGNLFDEWD